MKKIPLKFIIICCLLIFSSFKYGNSAENNTENLWEIIRSSATWDTKYLSPKIKNSNIIQSELKKISRNPKYLQTMNKRAEPFLYHIVTEMLAMIFCISFQLN